MSQLVWIIHTCICIFIIHDNNVYYYFHHVISVIHILGLGRCSETLTVTDGSGMKVISICGNANGQHS